MPRLSFMRVVRGASAASSSPVASHVHVGAGERFIDLSSQLRDCCAVWRLSGGDGAVRICGFCKLY